MKIIRKWGATNKRKAIHTLVLKVRCWIHIPIRQIQPRLTGNTVDFYDTECSLMMAGTRIAQERINFKYKEERTL